MSIINLFFINLGVVLLLMFIMWLICVPLQDTSIVDPFWGMGFVVIAVLSFAITDMISVGKVVILILTGIWGLRLSVYLTWRKWGEPEDSRYGSMRNKIGAKFWWISLFVVFWLQGLIMLVVSLPLQSGMIDQTAFGLLGIFGILVWLAGICFETIGDYQLARFRSNPENKGKVLDRGLWRYTRHPNYFGDFLVWWGLFLVAFGNGAAWWTIIGPIAMSILLMRISGVTLLEKSLRNTKKGYKDYVRRTSAFFPWPPKTRSSEQSNSLATDS